MIDQGYYRYPALSGDHIVFVSEDDLWSVTHSAGNQARRLTNGLGAVSSTVFSKAGDRIAFSANNEGHTELYVMPSCGGMAERLTYFGENVQVIGWTDDGIIFASSSGQPFAKWNTLWCMDPTGGTPRRLPLGPANFGSFQAGITGPAVLQRHGYREYGFWKRYRGGTAGQLWIDPVGSGEFHVLLSLKSDLARPLWVNNRIYFASDHEGIGNLYSCAVDGSDLRRHTHHDDYYVRNQSTDGTRIVYHAGGDLYVYDPVLDQSEKVILAYGGSRDQRSRKFVAAARYMDGYAIHPKGHHLAVTSRGQSFSFGNWEGPVQPLGLKDGVRYRLPQWLCDGKSVVLVTDRDGDESLELYDAATGALISASPPLPMGRCVEVMASPAKKELLLLNHRSELIHVDVDTWTVRILDRSLFGMMHGACFSPDGEWAAYHSTITPHKGAIKLVHIETGVITQITDPVLNDVCPAFDPDGKYLYFLSFREFDPSWDMLHFDMGFPRGVRPYLITLQKDLTSPFLPKAPDLECIEAKDDKEDKDDDSDKTEVADKSPTVEIKKITIDLDGIQNRLLAFPVDDGRYGSILALKGKVAFLSFPIEGALNEDMENDDGLGDGFVEVFDFETQKTEEIIDRVSDIALSADASHFVYLTGRRLRVFKVDDKPDERPECCRKTGWVSLNRLRVQVNPVQEWEQMYKEAWRLQRDNFWVEDMSKVDWSRVFDRYHTLIGRVSSRGEFSDLLWEMQGELGTSHAYVMGGDNRVPPRWRLGHLAAEFSFDADAGAYRIARIARGDGWNPDVSSPLCAPGLDVKDGDLLWEIQGQPLNSNRPPESYLVNQCGLEVRLTVSAADGTNKRSITVKTIANPMAARYRDWVNANRAYVHNATDGRVGYIHIPDMGPLGFAEFHRGFLSECDRDGLVVDVRFNGGGSVSPLLLEKLARRRLGYDATRWFGMTPYPADSPMGPMVALTNEYAGSDGDMFSHAFKMMKLGPLLGKRTWGGVIGIWPRHSLIDGGMTTQPEFSFWFRDVGWRLENYGVDPDIEVDIAPQDYVAGRDPQLDRSIEEVLKIMETYPTLVPDLDNRPSLALPTRLSDPAASL